MQHWRADTSVPVAVWSKGEDGEYLGKARYHWGLQGEGTRHLIANEMAFLYKTKRTFRVGPPQSRGEKGNTFIALPSTLYKV